MTKTFRFQCFSARIVYKRLQLSGGASELVLPQAAGISGAPRRSAGAPVVGQLREGLSFLLSSPELTVATIVLAGKGAFIYSTSSIIPLIAQYELGVGPEQFGLLMAAVRLGSLIMALTIATRGRSSQRILLTAEAVFGLFYLSLAFAPSFAVGFVLLVLVGGSIQVFGTSVNSLMQMGSPDHPRGRVMAVFTLAGEAAICLTPLVLALGYRARAGTALATQGAG